MDKNFHIKSLTVNISKYLEDLMNSEVIKEPIRNLKLKMYDEILSTCFVKIRQLNEETEKCIEMKLEKEKILSNEMKRIYSENNVRILI